MNYKQLLKAQKEKNRQFQNLILENQKLNNEIMYMRKNTSELQKNHQTEKNELNK